VQADADRFEQELTRVRRLRWIGLGIELILAGVGCIIAGVFFTSRPRTRSVRHSPSGAPKINERRDHGRNP